MDTMRFLNAIGTYREPNLVRCHSLEDIQVCILQKYLYRVDEFKGITSQASELLLEHRL